MEPPEGWDPSGRPARRTQWLLSALAHRYGLERGVENEMVVLASGPEQSLQEIFQQRDCAGPGRIPGEESRTLCRALGPEEAAEPEECAGLWDGLWAELTFRQLHARLCGHFSTRAGPRLPLGREGEHIESHIRPRSPRRARAAAAGALLPRALRGDGGAGAGRGAHGRAAAGEGQPAAAAGGRAGRPAEQRCAVPGAAAESGPASAPRSRRRLGWPRALQERCCSRKVSV